MSVDATLLRNAIRLVHCLQKERGSSCAYYANNSAFNSAMKEARSASDVSAALIRRNDVPVASTLEKIRNMISSHRNPQESKDEFALHRIFVCFNTLISYVVHQYILKVISDGTDQKPRPSTVRNRHRRSLSIDINAKLSAVSTITPDAPNNHKTFGSATPRNLIKLKTLPSTEELIDSELDEIVPAPPPPPPHVPASNDASSFLEPKRVAFEEGKTKIQQILDLLHLFVQLKESAGVERAILSSLLAFRGTDDPSLGLLVSDLILEVENQRSLIGQLEHLPEDTHRELVLELARLSPQLQELQMIILSDFESLKGAQYDFGTIWDHITLYIDKLHSVELFLVEELECCLPVTISKVLSSTSLSSMVINQTMSESTSPLRERGKTKNLDERLLTCLSIQKIFGGSSDKDTHSKLESLSADDIKARLLEILAHDESKKELDCDAQKQLKEEVHQHSAAINLKQDMQMALDQSIQTSAPSKTKGNEWEISIYELKFTKRIGVGAAATTYLADWSGQEVAVKVASTSRFGLTGWRTEVDALQRLHHPNIIRLLGSVYHETPLTYCLVLEYCNAGDLSTVLKYPTPKNFFFTTALGVANAMLYLHGRGIIHRDLKPANILCDGNVASGHFGVKVTDFGVATEISESSFADGTNEGSLSDKETRNLTGETGTYRWMAPEVIRHESYTTNADVYSFAILLWQLLSREDPFLDKSANDAARLSAVEKERPPMPSQVPTALDELIRANWDDDPSIRWSFEKISIALRILQTNMNADEKKFLESPKGHPVYEYEEVKVEKLESEKKPTKASKQKRTSLLSTFFGSKRPEKRK